ncbi:DUF1549 and DUF1553 domain-containing protein [bacterium]|nr:DUF1553 domain-containing protein [Verrucomicrobiota bacterium]MDA7632648.1 DUF1549 and DUF1553 domain-containing protein [bacterium]
MMSCGQKAYSLVIGSMVFAFVALLSAEVDHWAYLPLVKPDLPAGSMLNENQTWVRQPLDTFILAKQFEHGLRPSVEVDRLTWLRRVSLDLIGLPPTMEERRYFLEDDRPDAWDRVVSRLLESPHYGERWARHWMDLVHFAETHGHDQDRPREHSWPYRDYLIRAFNLDKPYAAFVQEQVAGDVLFPNDPWAVVATGFLATGPWDESSLRDIRPDSIDRLVGHYVDRDDIVTTTFSTFVSSTVHCARCHDHKFDPISQREYYGLQAVFAGIDKANRPFDWDPAVSSERRRLESELADLQQRLSDESSSILDSVPVAEFRQWEYEYQRDQIQWEPVEIVELTTSEGSELKLLDDGSVLANGKLPEKDTYEIVFRSSLPLVTGIRLEVLADPSLPHRGPGRHENGNFHLNEVSFLREVESSPTWKVVKLENVESDFDQKDWSIDKVLDGKDETAWGIHPEEGKDHVALFTLSKPLAASAFEGSRLKIQLVQSHGRQHLIGRFRVSTTDATAPITLNRYPSPVRLALKKSWGERSESERKVLISWFAERRLKAALAALPQPSLVYSGTRHFAPDGTFSPAVEPRPIHLLARGDVLRPGKEVGPSMPSLVQMSSEAIEIAELADEGARRSAMAAWLTSRSNPLLWRSIVNRVWLRHFGRGLVDTPNDFGRMGSSPTHPELLDWLAINFRDSGGSLKDLHRRIVTSATYRQASIYDSELAKMDADNRFLWRMNRRRLDAESIRDSMLQISGDLNTRMGGVSDRQFIQSKGVHVTPTLDYLNFDAADPANLRRSVYRFIFRTVPDPFMQAMDCPDASLLSPQRQESMTALQALAVLNDKFVIRQSERLAERLRRESETVEGRVTLFYDWLFGRSPDPTELTAVIRYAEMHGLSNACRFLLNSNEFMFVD